ncbi:MAG: hypothetical protein L6Q81_08830 [Bacteroidia bacterium]|nr:hypothetical protein [Bacteroidia bacterium]
MSKNTVKEKKEPETQTKPQQKSSGGNIVTKTIGSVMSGSFLSKEAAIKAVPFMFFLTLVALLYISNGYYAEDQIRRMNKLTNELKELRSEYIISKSELAAVSKQTEVAVRALSLGVKESVEPPSKIVVNTLPE